MVFEAVKLNDSLVHTILTKRHMIYEGLKDGTECLEQIQKLNEKEIGFILTHSDPIFWGLVIPNPWQYVEHSFAKITIKRWRCESVARLLACGWPVTMPQAVRQVVDGAKLYRTILHADEHQAKKPWLLPGAKKLVTEHYLSWGHAFLPYEELPFLRTESLTWYCQYLKFLKHYKLILPTKWNYLAAWARSAGRAP